MPSRALFGATVLLTASLSAVPTAAGDDPRAAVRASIAARVGERAISVGELEDRLAEIPAFQRAAFGASADAIRRRFLADVVVPQAMLELEATSQGLDQNPALAYAIDRARSSATLRSIREHIGAASAVPVASVRTYFEANRDRFDAPERYQVWRILCKTRDEAQAVLDATKRDPTPKTFADLARAHSLDKATFLRAGNLGFLGADGVSREPGLRVEPRVMQAVQGVRDGDLVSTPVTEGEYFAVVWRRGTLAAVHERIDDVAAQIRESIVRERLKVESERVLVRLRLAKLHDLNEAPLESDLSAPTSPGLGPSKAADGG